ncbi:hypothetical protein B738_27872 [Photorhabdus temperata subsp. temperata M1021]|nr:hypothetical protein B738_27872 [Photorhabdus temperata subsp. temperata M1021]
MVSLVPRIIFFIQKFLNDEGNASEAHIAHYSSVGKEQIGAVLVWHWQLIAPLRVGHVSFVLFTNSNDIKDPENTYISWWPGESAVNMTLTAPPKLGATYESDKKSEKGDPNKTRHVYSRNADAVKERIEQWWIDFQRNEKRWAMSQNCATTIKDLLVNVGAYNAIDDSKLDYYYSPGFWVPNNLINIIEDINRGTGTLE